MAYTISCIVDPKIRAEVQKHPKKFEKWTKKWQALNPEVKVTLGNQSIFITVKSTEEVLTDFETH